ncbi:MAG: hypothetical protein ACE5E1_06650 [Phycisphaerae bacterium]
MTILERVRSKVPHTYMLASLLVFALIGCEQPAEPGATDQSGAVQPTAQAPKPKPAPTARAPKLAEKPVTLEKPAAVEKTAPAPKVSVKVVKAKPANAPSLKPTPASVNPKVSERQAKTDLIYATIRVRMEEMIEQRKELLASGTPPSDERVRKLEGSIMRARGLLIENGETVEDVDPPIVLPAPKK